MQGYLSCFNSDCNNNIQIEKENILYMINNNISILGIGLMF